MSKTEIVRSVELHFPHLTRSHSPFGQEIYDVQIRTTDEPTKDQLVELGVNMKKHDDGYFHANVKRNVLNRKGEKNKPPVIVDNNKQPWDLDKSIGAGTTANIKLFSYEWSQMGRSGTSAMLQAVQILEWKEGQDSGPDFDVEDAAGF